MSQGHSGTASGGQLEEKADFSKETDEKLAQVTELIQSSGGSALAEALAILGALEKRCRVGNDGASLDRVCQAAVQACKDVGDHEAVIQTINNFATRRSQKMSAIKVLVQTPLPWCVEEPYTPVAVANKEEKDIRDKLVTTLRDITEGKLFLERERAQLTRALAKIKEEEGNVSEAADYLQEVHVETYGSLSKKEKVEYILEQLRLTLAKKDYVRAAIVSGKINRKHLAEMAEYKIRFFTLLSVLHRHEKDALELVKDYHSIYLTLQENEENEDSKWQEALQATVIFLALSPYGNEQQDILNRVNMDPNLEKLSLCKSAVQLFLNKEIINYPVPGQQELENSPFFVDDGLGEHWHGIFRQRITQHNVRIAAMYYKCIRMTRLAQLLELEPKKLEAEIASMVSDGTVYAKIDRPADIIRFEQKKSSEAVLTSWADNIDKLLHLVETTTHLIHKERKINAK